MGNCLSLSMQMQKENAELYRLLHNNYNYLHDKWTFELYFINNNETLIITDDTYKQNSFAASNIEPNTPITNTPITNTPITNIKKLKLEIEIYNNYKNKVNINLYEVYNYINYEDIYEAKEKSYNLLKYNNWFDNIDIDNKILHIDNINYKFLDFLLNSGLGVSPLFQILFYLKSIRE